MARAGQFVLILVGAVLWAAPGPAQQTEGPPTRVVSMNLCTDQLAMLIAAPGQLRSVSHLATDPSASAMAEEALDHDINHGLAEEIYLMRPDLVIAGSFSNRATLDMLRRLEIPLAVFEPAYGLDEVRDRMRQMGEVLGQQDRAEMLIADYDARLAALSDDIAMRPDAALYYANGYTSGDRTLAGQILIAAGFDNAAVAAGSHRAGSCRWRCWRCWTPKRSSPRAPIPEHPDRRTFSTTRWCAHCGQDRASGTFTDRDWVCGTPYVLRAIEGLGALRRDMTDGLRRDGGWPSP
jgi:iron complex transport system substrate-binding protein